MTSTAAVEMTANGSSGDTSGPGGTLARRYSAARGSKPGPPASPNWYQCATAGFASGQPATPGGVAAATPLLRGAARSTTPAPSSAVGSLPDDLALHRAQQTEQLALLPRADTVLVERFGQILDGRVPLHLADVHALVRRLHVASEVRARPSRRVADLIREVRLQPEHRGRLHALKAGVHAGVGDHVRDEVVDDQRDPITAAEPLVERGRLRPHRGAR